jgi:nitrous oxide reductase accessory protein NosL
VEVVVRQTEALRRAGGVLTALAWTTCLGCAAAQGPPPIHAGSACATCGMEVGSLRFACERRSDGAWRVFDSIECLARDTRSAADVWISDYDTATLHAADSMWVVRGDIPSPMGGGLAAFIERASADEVAASSHGRVMRFETLDALAERP